MPRHARLGITGGIYHVITRGIERRKIFNDNTDREEFLLRLEESLKQTGSKCYGWVLMPNHFHLLIRTGEAALSDLMRKLLTGYAIFYNRRHKRRGYLYQNRYKSVLCQEEQYLLELVRYIHLNPIRGKIVKSISELNKYKWSGHSALVGERDVGFQSKDEILERFGGKRNEAIKKYLKFIEEAKDVEKREDLSGGGLRRSAGGWRGVYELKRAKEFWRGDERVLGDGKFVNDVLKASDEEIVKRERLKREGWDIDRVAVKVCKIFGIDKSGLRRRSRGTKISQARAVVAYWCYNELRITGVEIGKYFSITRPSVSAAIKRGEACVRDNNLKLIN